MKANTMVVTSGALIFSLMKRLAAKGNKTTLVVAHYNDFTLSAMASQISGVSIICSTIWSGARQRTHQSSKSLAFVRGIYR